MEDITVTESLLNHNPLLAPACVTCLFGKAIERYPAEATREEILTYQRRLGELLANLPDRTCGPAILEIITAIHAEVFGDHSDEETARYADIKRHFNALMADFAATEELPARIRAAADPLREALGYAMTGNYIDFGALGSVDEKKLSALLTDAAERVPADSEAYADLVSRLSAARRLVFLTDNCGEVVMDMLLIGYLREAYPELDITVILRGAPVLNDATMEDAAQIGLDRMEGIRVMGNGDGLAGTALGRISPEAREAITAADVILAKGQGNYETLNGCGLPICYAFLCKCSVFAERFGVSRYTGMLTWEDKDAKNN